MSTPDDTDGHATPADDASRAAAEATLRRITETVPNHATPSSFVRHDPKSRTAAELARYYRRGQ